MNLNRIDSIPDIQTQDLAKVSKYPIPGSSLCPDSKAEHHFVRS